MHRFEDLIVTQGRITHAPTLKAMETKKDFGPRGNPFQITYMSRKKALKWLKKLEKEFHRTARQKGKTVRKINL